MTPLRTPHAASSASCGRDNARDGGAAGGGGCSGLWPTHRCAAPHAWSAFACRRVPHRRAPAAQALSHGTSRIECRCRVAVGLRRASSAGTLRSPRRPPHQFLQRWRPSAGRRWTCGGSRAASACTQSSGPALGRGGGGWRGWRQEERVHGRAARRQGAAMPLLLASCNRLPTHVEELHGQRAAAGGGLVQQCLPLLERRHGVHLGRRPGARPRLGRGPAAAPHRHGGLYACGGC